MKVLSFNLKKISASKDSKFKGNYSISTNITFVDLGKDKIEVIKADEVFNLAFRFTVTYSLSEKKDQKENKVKEEDKKGEVVFEGNIILLAEKDEAKLLQKAWKKKEIPNSVKIPLFNIILKKCSSKALSLEEEIGLPYHIPLPVIQAKPQNQ